MGEGQEWVLALPWRSPPLTLNQRLHWRAHARLARELRQAASVLARSEKVPALARCRVQLCFAPPDNRRRDADNLVATLKPLCDGLVDAGVVPDDTPELMVKPMPRIVLAERPPRVWLVVTSLPPSEVP